MKGKTKPVNRKDGGKIEEAGGNPEVLAEAKEKKNGGRIKKRKAGGKVLGLMTGGSVRPRLDRPGRKSGGAVGSNKNPLSSAHNSTSPGSD